MNFTSLILRRPNTGITLISVVMGLAIAGIIAFAATSLFSTSTKVISTINSRLEKQNLLNNILLKLDCERTATIAGRICNDNYLDLYSKNSTAPIIAANGSRYYSSKYWLRAQCLASPYGDIAIYYAFNVNTLATGVTPDWKPLNDGIYRHNCAQQMNGSGN